jgi:hypothetical protein
MGIPLQEAFFPYVVRYILFADEAGSQSFNLKIEAIGSSETFVLTRATASSYPSKQHSS